MTNVTPESTINGALISLSRSFLQYVAESWPWVNESERRVEEQVRDLAAHQREDVGALVAVLMDREWNIDFGTYPTEYTDLHFMSLTTLLEWLLNGQAIISDRLAATSASLRESGDAVTAELTRTIALRQNDVAAALKKLQAELAESVA